MDFSTIVLAVLAVGASSLAIVIGLAHRDMLAAIVRMDRSATAAEHAAQGAKEAAVAANHAADPCIAMAEQVKELVQTSIHRPPPTAG
jgi:hypothetical protein